MVLDHQNDPLATRHTKNLRTVHINGRAPQEVASVGKLIWADSGGRRRVALAVQLSVLRNRDRDTGVRAEDLDGGAYVPRERLNDPSAQPGLGSLVPRRHAYAVIL